MTTPKTVAEIKALAREISLVHLKLHGVKATGGVFKDLGHFQQYCKEIFTGYDIDPSKLLSWQDSVKDVWYEVVK